MDSAPKAFTETSSSGNEMKYSKTSNTARLQSWFVAVLFYHLIIIPAHSQWRCTRNSKSLDKVRLTSLSVVEWLA